MGAVSTKTRSTSREAGILMVIRIFGDRPVEMDLEAIIRTANLILVVIVVIEIQYHWEEFRQ